MTNKDNFDEVIKELAMEAATVYNNNAKTVASFDNFRTIIDETIEEYNYKGKNFKTKYLPVILAMALKKQEFKDYSFFLNELKTLNKNINALELVEKNVGMSKNPNKLKEILKRNGFGNIRTNMIPKGFLVRVKRTRGDKTFLGFYHI
jgi:uncharacterized coiled-coil DUF342 family protein